MNCIKSALSRMMYVIHFTRKKLPTFTTSEMAHDKADIRICLTRSEPLKYRWLFLGLHVDFSTHQMMLYMGLFTLTVELYPPHREYPVFDKYRMIWKTGKIKLVFHNSNHSKRFFNIGITFREGYMMLFFYQFQLYIQPRPHPFIDTNIDPKDNNSHCVMYRMKKIKK